MAAKRAPDEAFSDKMHIPIKRQRSNDSSLSSSASAEDMEDEDELVQEQPVQPAKPPASKPQHPQQQQRPYRSLKIPSKSQQGQPVYTSGPPDPTTGQRSVFFAPDPSTASCDGGTASAEALAYLSSVRNEAAAIPHLLSAPRPIPTVDIRNFNTQPEPDTANPDLDAEQLANPETQTQIHSLSPPAHEPGGFYSDHAYVALPSRSPSPTPDDSSNPDSNPAVVFHRSLLARFRAHRALLHRSPPAHLLDALDTAAHPFELPPAVSWATAVRHWLRLLLETRPRAVQLAAITPEFALRLLRLAAGRLKRTVWGIRAGVESGRVEKEGEGVPREARNLALWIWGLLGRLDEVNAMSTAEVAEVRELGKRAVRVLEGLRMVGLIGTGAGGDRGGGEGEDEGEEVQEDDEEEIVLDESEVEETFATPPSAAGTAGAAEEMPEAPDGALQDMQADAALAAAKKRLLDGLAGTASPPPGAGETVAEAHSDGVLSDVEMDMASEASSEEGEIVGADAEVEAQVNAVEEAAVAGPKDAQVALCATLDMILTVVGEEYGQRDLLDTRDRLWT